MIPRILAIDDEEEWLKNFRAWIPQKLAVQDSAGATSEASAFLRRCRYHVVLLDLSMDVRDDLNRTNYAIQEYLSVKPEGTTYMIVSGTIKMPEAIDSAFHLNAYYIIEKPKIEPGILREKVIQAINQASKEDPRIIVDARMELTDSGRLEDQVLRTLHPAGGAKGMYPMMDALFDRIAPIVPHRDRPRFDFLQDSVAGLVWSRQLGMAVSVVLANKKISEDTSRGQLADWLGYPQNQRPLFSRDVGGVRIECFAEADVSDSHFDLPMVATAD
jgi:CheY-like chemotaxis protein